MEFKTLTVVNSRNSFHPLKVYQFLKDIGSKHIQFIPLVERMPDQSAQNFGLNFAAPPNRQGRKQQETPVAQWSVKPRQYGVFLFDIFMNWIHNDLSRIFVYNFEEVLARWCGWEPTICVFNKTCGNAMVIEHNGDVYSCDHYVYPNYKIGNVMEQSVREMALSVAQEKFGRDKFDTLPRYCLDCEVFHVCIGECPKYRFMKAPDGEEGLNYLCEGYKYLFKNIDPYMKKLAQQIRGEKNPPPFAFPQDSQ